MERVIARFDYTRDPIPAFVARIQAMRVPERFLPGLLASVVALVVSIASVWIGHSQLATARSDHAKVERSMTLAAAELAARRIDADRVQGLLAIDRHLRAIRESGYEMARLLDDFAVQLPRGVWVTSIEPSEGGVDAIGLGIDLHSIESAVHNLTDARFGAASLRRVARTEGRAPTLFAFTIHVERL